jgi:hypothetical protein
MALMLLPDIDLPRLYGLPKLILSCPPQTGKSMAAEDFAAWMIGRQPDWRIIYASYSDGLGARMNLNLHRMMMARRYREVFPRIIIGASGWVANTTMIEFAGFNDRRVKASPEEFRPRLARPRPRSRQPPKVRSL